MKRGEEMLLQIVDKCSSDSDFRAQMLSNPKSTISDEFGITIPDSMNVVVHESDLQTVHIALPPNPYMSEEQLEAISAGLSCCV